MKKDLDISVFGLKLKIELGVIAPLLMTGISLVTSFFALSSQKSVKWVYVLTGLLGVMGAILVYVLAHLIITPRSRRIFVSYSNKDKEFVDVFLKELAAKDRFDVYSGKDIPVGGNIKEAIASNIEKSEMVLVILSRDAVASNWMQAELEYALEKNKKLFPIVIDPQMDIPVMLRNLRYADLSSRTEKERSAVIQELNDAMKSV